MKLFKKQYCFLPSLSGWTLLFLSITIIILVFALNIHPFLAVNKSIQSENIIVEGWMPDYCLLKVDSIYKTNDIKKIFVTGGPLERGFYLIEYKNFAALGASTLRTLGIPDSIIVEIPAPYVIKDRTLTSSKALKTWLDTSNYILKDATIITHGIHSRRSFMVFKKSLPKIKLGVISIENQDYKPQKWFVSSAGTKMVITEIISYLYTLLFCE